MTIQIKDIKASLTRLEYYERLANQKYDAWDADPFNPDREEAADKAYALEWNEFIYAVHLISRFANIDEKSAMALIKHKRTEILNIFNA